jgi:hypothetical protein
VLLTDGRAVAARDHDHCEHCEQRDGDGEAKSHGDLRA